MNPTSSLVLTCCLTAMATGSGAASAITGKALLEGVFTLSEALEELEATLAPRRKTATRKRKAGAKATARKAGVKAKPRTANAGMAKTARPVIFRL